jgi:hypothetical protein
VRTFILGNVTGAPPNCSWLTVLETKITSVTAEAEILIKAVTFWIFGIRNQKITSVIEETEILIEVILIIVITFWIFSRFYIFFV